MESCSSNVQVDASSYEQSNLPGAIEDPQDNGNPSNFEQSNLPDSIEQLQNGGDVSNFEQGSVNATHAEVA